MVTNVGPSPRFTGSFTSAGIQMSWASGNPNFGGMTPMIVVGAPLIRTVFPATFGSLLNCVCHTRCAISATGAAPGSASASVRSRPWIGVTRSTVSVFGVIRRPRSRSGKPFSVESVTFSPEYPASDSNDFCCVRQSVKSCAGAPSRRVGSFTVARAIIMIRSLSGNGRPRRITPSTIENIVVVRPMPSARAMIAIADVPGRLTIIRAP